MKNYVLTVRIPIEARDSIGARQAAKVKLCAITHKEIEGAEVKLQEVFPDKPPVGIEFRESME